MKTLVPAVYKDFRCIGSACKDNCCIGWEIDIDDRTAAFYRDVPGVFGERLKRDIDWDTQCFRLAEGERCPFLNGQNLCDIILHLGEEHLCDICDRHPRFRNVLPARVEMGIGLCCEEAVRQFLTCEEKMALVSGPDVDEEPVEIDRTLLYGCGKVRDLAFSVIQNRKLPLTDRVRQLLTLADELWLAQDDTGMGQAEVAARYDDPEKLQPYEYREPIDGEKELIWSEVAEVFLSLERLDENWTPLLMALADKTEEKELPDIPFEQLIWYFLFRHMMAAAEDGDVAGWLTFAVVSFLVIRRMVQQGGELQDIVRRYCKEIEYSTDNMYELLDSFAAERCFEPDALAVLI